VSTELSSSLSLAIFCYWLWILIVWLCVSEPGGGTFCAVAALYLMGFIQPDLASNLRESASINVQLLLEWCLQVKFRLTVYMHLSCNFTLLCDVKMHGGWQDILLYPLTHTHSETPTAIHAHLVPDLTNWLHYCCCAEASGGRGIPGEKKQAERYMLRFLVCFLIHSPYNK
jgi:hypothetical protein